VSGSGTFSGEGYVGIPYLNNAQVAVTFNNITVNTDLQLISGFVETKFDPVNANLVMDVDEKLTGGSGVGDIRSGEERAAFEVTYVLNPNVQVKPLVTDDSRDDIKDGGGGNAFIKGENGKYQLVFTDDEGNEHIQETDAFPFTVKDKSGNTFEVTLQEDSDEIKVAQENMGYSYMSQNSDTISKEELIRFKNKIIEELQEATVLIDIDNYTEPTVNQYLTGAIKNIENLSNYVEIVSYRNLGAMGWYENGILYVSYLGNEDEDDVKSTIFHEYLHSINYQYKILPYRYSNETMRYIYQIKDDCFYTEQKMELLYDKFTFQLNQRLITEYWPLKYEDLNSEQEKEFLLYIEKTPKNDIDSINCSPGTYRPSNYYRDEISVYNICLKMDKILFEMSDIKKSTYKKNIIQYEDYLKDSINYEERNNLNEEGYEKDNF
jgi:hypothetical protein